MGRSVNYAGVRGVVVWRGLTFLVGREGKDGVFG
jgi:hypothetical protein